MLRRTKSNVLLSKEFRKLQRTPKHESDRIKYKNKSYIPSDVVKLYSTNTDDFEPTEENREHLLITLFPLINDISFRICKRHGFRIEYEDCINQGMIGASIATDRYIKKSKVKKQVAKLSSYAYPYIDKYINEFCREHSNPLSYGTTQWIEANETTNVNSGDAPISTDDSVSSYFDVAPTKLLQDVQDSEYTERIDKAIKYARMLFGGLTPVQKQIVSINFGITEDSKTPKEIAKQLSMRIKDVEYELECSVEQMKEVFTDPDEIIEVINTIKNTNISKFI
ncbi:hypothetical protein HYO65_gp168 [Tenacibaculum phage PTm1]|uniref:RNA polymerase sigma factor n=2 Tax=Shirahamavirus PTm1 TaxID=2846435 RepID=A0A5S9BZ37_9CAUD|nr:hypothetical protein HYO65_gp168 [Tenacibaculum phage PTm1]BBI90560.1 hypothetical protein [Tenacibaculum phage PTm1]BBI90868.1 hypothetical protein [Tenacibaculum phage PTm5]